MLIRRGLAGQPQQDGRTSAVGALIEALKDPTLDTEQRRALIDALDAAIGTTPSEAAEDVSATRTKSSSAGTQRQRLTKSAVAALPLPASGERLVYDEQTPQLAVRLRPSGRTYVVSMWDRKRRRRVSHTLGKVAYLTPEQAREQAQQLVGAVASGGDLRRARAAGMTLGQLVDAWHAEKAKSKRTADEMRNKVLDHCAQLKSARIDEVTREQIGAIHHQIATKARRRVIKRVGDELQSVEVGEAGIPATADKVLAILSSVFGWAVAKGIAGSNPCKGLRKAFNAKEASRQTYLHGEALTRFWQALMADPDADVRDVLLLAIYTGQRKGNVLGMRWDHVDLQHGLWTIPGQETKQRSPQTNPLSAQALTILVQRHADAASPWVFPAVRRNRTGDIGHMSETRPRAAWERICDEAGLEGVRIHDLRHTAGSWLARLGANEAVRQKALGHRTPQMAARYAHLELDPVADAMQRMGDAITAAATTKRVV